MRVGKGSHRIWYNPLTGKVSSIPDWGARDLTLGTVRAVIRELGISRREFGPIQ
jgi:predicted RNA binding protein YcfA (HicA-like mRNA interferase family)